MLIEFGNAMKLTKAINPNSVVVDGEIADAICQHVFSLPYVAATDRGPSGRSCDLF